VRSAGRVAFVAGALLAARLLAGCALDARYVVASPGAAAPGVTVVPSASPSRTSASSTPPSPASAAGPTPSDTRRSQDPVAPSPAVSAAYGRSGDLIPVLDHIDTTDPVVFITIDDGFDKDPRVLALLEARHVPVTPFLTVDAVRAEPGFFSSVQRITGQTVQDHTVSHPHLSTLGLRAQTREICDASDELERLYGGRPWLFRPPYGDYDRNTRRAAATCGIKALVLWDVSLPHKVLRYARGSVLKPGDIILIHWRPYLYRDLPIAIDAAEAQGLRVAALQDYLPRS
jgi:peptidoglycan/xylan/chitin deacetylase (PgdA/CDA1 family)